LYLRKNLNTHSMKLLFVLLFIVPISLFCQKSDSTNKSKLSIGLTFSPDYCYRTLRSDANSKWIEDYRNAKEVPKFGYTSGINMSVKLNKRFSFETALLYADRGMKTKEYELLAPGQSDPVIPKTIKYNYHYIYLDVPIKMNFYLLTKKIKLFIETGISPSLLFTQYNVAYNKFSDGHESVKKSTNTLYSYPRINLTAIAGIGLNYDLSEKLYFKAEPMFRYSLSTFGSTPIREHLYSAGLNTGIFLKL